MPGLPIHDLPPTVRTAWIDLRDRLRGVLGDDLVAMWAHGGNTSGDPAHSGDLDTYVLLAHRPDEATARAIGEAHATTADAHGVEWDAWHVLADDARRSDAPPHAWREGRRDTSWAIHRAHWLAGRYVELHGADPSDIVPAPTWDELTGELDRELEHIERHVVEGDTDPFEATYALLTGSRIMYSLAERDVAISKRAAGIWALEHLPARWHDALRIAVRAYDRRGSAADAEQLAAEMAPFVSFVRGHLPPTSERPPGALPRWSGY